jgi:hypothetical protein
MIHAGDVAGNKLINYLISVDVICEGERLFAPAPPTLARSFSETSLLCKRRTLAANLNINLIESHQRGFTKLSYTIHDVHGKEKAFVIIFSNPFMGSRRFAEFSTKALNVAEGFQQ